jgi:PAS domain S-box-containing protein
MTRSCHKDALYSNQGKKNMLQEERPDLKEQLEQRIAELENELRMLDSDDYFEPAGGDIDVGTEYRSSLERFLAADSIAMIRASLTGAIIDVNQAFTDMLGYTKEEALSGALQWTEITPPEWKPSDDLACEQILQTGNAAAYAKELVHKDGHKVPVMLAVGGADPEGEDCLCLFVDISEQKRKEAELKLSEAQFRLLAESIPQMVFTVGADGATDYFNKRWGELTGVQPTRGFENTWHELCHPDDVERVQAHWYIATENRSVVEIEARYKRKDGTFAWALQRAFPLIAEDGSIAKWFGTLTDIHEQKQAEEEIRASEIRFRTLADAIPQIVWTADGRGKIDFFNHRWFEYTGLTIEQSLDDGWKLLIHPDDLPLYLKEWENAMATGDTYEVNFRLRRALGLKKDAKKSYRRHLGRAVALRAKNGQVIKWFATWTEIEHQGTSDEL